MNKDAKSYKESQMWWYIPVIPALRMLRQVKHKLEASLVPQTTKVCPQSPDSLNQWFSKSAVQKNL